MSSDALVFVLPELVLVAFATLIFVAGAFVPRPALWHGVALGGLVAAGGAVVVAQSYFPPEASALVSDSLGWFFRLVVLSIGMLFVLMAQPDRYRRASTPEVLGSILLILAGLMLVAVSRDLVLLFAGLELVSIPTYVLLYLSAEEPSSAGEREAAAKYFFLSVLASALLLYGFSFLYGLGGSTDLGEIRQALSQLSERSDAAPAMARIALVLVVAGLAFRLTAAPFHFYAPDVYEGTSNFNAALLSVIPKLAGVAAVVRVAVIAMPGLESFGWRLALVLSVLTMTIGNLVALWQDNVRRLMAYSSIAHGGYLLVGLAAGIAMRHSPAAQQGVEGIQGVLFYLAVYALATTALFAGLIYAGGDEPIDRVNQLAGLARSQPGTAVCMSIALFSLAGIPPLAGFWGKFELFTSAASVGLAPEGQVAGSMRAWFLGLAVIGVLNAAVACAYYLRLVGVMFFVAPERERRPSESWGPLMALMVSAVLVVAVGCYPAALEQNTRQAANIPTGGATLATGNGDLQAAPSQIVPADIAPSRMGSLRSALSQTAPLRAVAALR